MHVLLAASALSLCGISLAQELTLRVVAEPAPVGSSVQLKVFLAEPRQVAEGHLAIDLDPAVFGSIGNVAVFSATGDAIGYANVSGRHADAHFSSPSASIGQLPERPVFILTVPVIGAGDTALALNATGGWRGPGAVTYQPVFSSVTYSTGGRLSIASVTPGGGVLPPGSRVIIKGTGFTPSTTVTIDAVKFDAEIPGPEEIHVTLTGPAEMTGKRVRVTDGGDQIDFFCSLPSAAANSTFALPSVHPLVPLHTYLNARLTELLGYPFSTNGVALQNPGASDVEVALLVMDAAPSAGRTLHSFRIPPFGLYFLNAGLVAGIRSVATVHASSAIRMLEYRHFHQLPGAPAVTVRAPEPIGYRNLTVPSLPDRLAWSWRRGEPAPQPMELQVPGSMPFHVAEDRPGWLRATVVLPARDTR